MPLTIQQTKVLRSRAHVLKPVVIVGQNGLTENVLNEIDQSIDHHELIKVRVNATDRQQRTERIEQIAATTKSEIVQVVGHIAVLYRHNPQRNAISLPKP